MIYLDNAATTRVARAVIDEMNKAMGEEYGNASGVYALARKSHAALELARTRVASLIGAQPREIFFTSGGTESDNWAIKGAVMAAKHRSGHIITSKAEHSAVLETCSWLGAHGYNVTYLTPDAYGMISPETLKRAMRRDTILVSLMTVNNEVGTVNPIKELAAVAKSGGALFHTDAVQAVGHFNVNVADMGVDLLSLSGHKIYAPKGVGALYVRSGIQLEKLMHGGKQERTKRGGTENMPGIVGLGMAAKMCSMDMEETTTELASLCRMLERDIFSIPGLKVNGHPTNRHPGILNITIDGIKSEKLLMQLDMAGIACSAGSACASGSHEPSHVLLAMGVPPERAKCSLRISLGRFNTEDDMRTLIKEIKKITKSDETINPYSAIFTPKKFV